MNDTGHLPSRIGSYPIEREVGRGGMGIVYLARDAKLDRPVAIKVLPDAFAGDPDRLARFEREARLLASLSHPNIAAIYGLEESEGHRFLVLEYVEGETLAQRLARGPLPVDDAIDVCRQIAAAVEAAHEGGVIHRDLKPGNVKLTPAGEVKVLDFGLAKGGTVSGVSSDPSLTASPTVALTAMTGAGVILGTAAYMSPEQARGRAVDRRTDIWSFGCVLYECLTGRQAFAGETVSDMIAMILQGEPAWKALPANLPPRVRELLERCLTKDAKKRLRDIGEARLVLEGGNLGVTSTIGPTAPGATAGSRSVTASTRLVYTFAAVLAVTSAALAWMLVARVPDPEATTRLMMPAPPMVLFPRDPACTALSPDGNQIAVSAPDSAGGSGIWLRRLDATEGRWLPGTQGSTILFWSPDSRYLVFSTMDKLQKIDTQGGNPEVLCPLTNQGRGGTWGSGNVIVFAPSGAGPLSKVSKDGGTPVPVTTLDSTETGHRFPRFLPDGRHFLYASLPQREGEYRIFIGSIDSPEHRLLMAASGTPAYVEPGYLMFVRKGRIVAQRFDASRRQLRGESTVLMDEPRESEFLGSTEFTASTRGALAYFHREATPLELVWFDRSSKRLDRVPAPAGTYEAIALSPDATRAAVVRTGSSNESDLWLADLAHGDMTRFTYGPGRVDRPVWSPDGSRIAFSSNRNGRWDLFVKSVNGGTPEEAVVTSGSQINYANAWSPDGQSLLFERLGEKTGWDLWEVTMNGGHTARPFLVTPFDELWGDISPAGGRICYDSNESGSMSVYVQSYPVPGNKHLVSSGPGSHGKWRSDGRELRFITQTGVCFVNIDPMTGAASGEARRVPRPASWLAGATARDFARSLVLARPDNAGNSTEITVVSHWPAELAKR